MKLTGLRVGVYARHSTEKQNPRSSEDQIARCVEWVAARDGVVSPLLVFRDDALTGQTTGRPGLQSMLRAAEAGRLDVLVVEDLSRVSRDAEDAHGIRKRLKFADVRLVSVSDGLDTGQGSSSLLFGVQAAMGEEYVRQLADKTRRGMQGRARAGKLTGAPPYGYDSAPSTDGAGSVAVINELQAVVVRRIFAERAAGRSYGAIAADLNRDGVPPPRGRQSDSRKRRDGWALGGVRSMLHNERYAGWWTFGARKWVRHPGTGKRVPKAGAEAMRIELPETRIVDAETWAACAALNARTAGEWRAAGGVGRARRVYPLSTLLRCAECGGPMVINCGHAPQYRCDASRGRGGMCTNRLSVREPDIRAAVLGRLLGYLGDPDIATTLVEVAQDELRQTRATSRVDTDAAVRSLEETERQIARLVDLAAAGTAPASVLERIRSLEDQASRQRAHVARLREMDRADPRLPTVEEVLAQAQRLGDLVEQDPARGRQALVELIGADGIQMTPQPDGAYLARWSITPAAMLAQAETPPGFGQGASSNGVSCGGAIGTPLGPEIWMEARSEPRFR